LINLLLFRKNPILFVSLWKAGCAETNCPMIKTGNIFIDFLSFLSIIFPLLPVAIILIKKNYGNESLIFLLIVCLLNFIKNFLLVIPSINTSSQNIISNVFSFLEFIFLLFIFKKRVPRKFTNTTNIFFSIFLSAIITIYLLRGVEQRLFVIEGFESAVVILASLFSIISLNNDNDLNILEQPLFWIAMGSLFYFSIAILLQSINWPFNQSSNEDQSGYSLLLNAGSIAKYLLYLLAAFFYDQSNRENHNNFY